MLALLVAVWIGSDSCSTCVVAGKDVRLCAPHATEERLVLAREGPRLASKEEAVRTAALDALAALTGAHANAPSERVAQRLASALDDESLVVRTHATELLGRPQHALVSLDALVGALAGTNKEHARLNGDYDSLTSKLEGKLQDKRREAIVAERQACDERRKALSRWRLALVDRLATFPDDRAVEAILTHTHRNLLVGGDVALVRLGSRKALGALGESFAACERDIAAAEQEVAAGKSVAGGNLTAREGLRMLAVERMKEASAKMRQELTALLAERGLEPPAPEADANAWRAWIDQNSARFPERLPGISSPAW